MWCSNPQKSTFKNAIITGFFKNDMSICSLIATLLYLPQSVLMSSEEFAKRNIPINKRILASFETYIIWPKRPAIMAANH